MKRKLYIFVALLIVGLVSISYAQIRNSMSSGLGSVDAVIASGRGVLTGVLIITDGTNAASVIVYDGLSATGTILFKGTVPGASMFGGATWEIPVTYVVGVYVDVSGTGANYIIYHDRG